MAAVDQHLLSVSNFVAKVVSSFEYLHFLSLFAERLKKITKRKVAKTFILQPSVGVSVLRRDSPLV